jgi:predicted metal-binding protein
VKLPFAARQALVKGGRVYALNQDGVTAWRMKPNA